MWLLWCEMEGGGEGGINVLNAMVETDARAALLSCCASRTH